MSRSDSRSSLLGLTPDIRLRLYRYLGLASWDGAPFRFDLRDGRVGETPHYSPPNPIHFHGLLLSCRTIYAEAAALLYSENYFVVYHYSRTLQLLDLQPLAALTDSSLRVLSNLKIVINEAACHRATAPDYDIKDCCRRGREDDSPSYLVWCRKRHRHVHQAPLLSDGAVPANDVRREWHAAATRVLSLATPGRLDLSLVCDIDPRHATALELANSILAPLRRLPRSYLKQCRIRLSDTPDHEFQKLAQDTASHACGLPTPDSQPSKKTSDAVTTTLMSLPRELRLRILEYTDLVTPRKQVMWSRQDRAYIVYRVRTDDNFAPDELHADLLFDCARGRPEGCFCARRHAAFSSACRCWVPPGPDLFLVCRTLCDEARYVLLEQPLHHPRLQGMPSLDQPVVARLGAATPPGPGPGRPGLARGTTIHFHSLPPRSSSARSSPPPPSATSASSSWSIPFTSPRPGPAQNTRPCGTGGPSSSGCKKSSTCRDSHYG